MLKGRRKMPGVSAQNAASCAHTSGIVTRPSLRRTAGRRAFFSSSITQCDAI
jgi:hypothetical protein